MRHRVLLNNCIYDLSEMDYNKLCKLIKEKDNKSLSLFIDSVQNSYNVIMEVELALVSPIK